MSNNENRARYGRAAMIIKELYPKMMRELAESNMPSTILYGMIDRDTFGFKSRLKKAEKDLVEKLRYTGYTDLDETFLYKLIRVFNLVQKPSRRWGLPPDSVKDTTSGDDVERMRTRRNSVIHRSSACLEEPEWTEFFYELIDIAQRCDQRLNKSEIQSFKKEAEKLKTVWLDTADMDNYIRALERIFELELQETLRMKDENVNVLLSFFYGTDIKELIKDSEHMSADELTDVVFVDMFVHGVVNKEIVIQRLRAILDKLEGTGTEMTATSVGQGSIFLHVRAKKEHFKNKKDLQDRLENLFRRLLPYMRDHIREELTIAMSIDTTTGEVEKFYESLSRDNVDDDCFGFRIGVKRENLRSKEKFHYFVQSIVSAFMNNPGEISRDFKDLDVVVEKCEDDIVSDAKKWKKIRNETLPELDKIERKLSDAGNDIRAFRAARNVGTGLAFLGLVLAPLTGGASLGFTVGAMTVGVGGVTLVTIIVENYLTDSVITEAQWRIDIDKKETEKLRERVSFYLDRGGDWTQERFAKELFQSFPDAIIRQMDKPLLDFLTSFIDTEVGSVFRARDEVVQLKRVLRAELEKVEKIQQDTLGVYF